MRPKQQPHFRILIGLLVASLIGLSILFACSDAPATKDSSSRDDAVDQDMDMDADNDAQPTDASLNSDSEGYDAWPKDALPNSETVLPPDIRTDEDLSDLTADLPTDLLHEDAATEVTPICGYPDAIGYCPEGWNEQDGTCIPTDCTPDSIELSSCVTDHVPIHVRYAGTWQSEIDEYCEQGESTFSFVPDFGPQPVYCYDVASIYDFLGPYFTRDGGATWTKSDMGSEYAYKIWSQPPLMLRSAAYPDVVVIMARSLISRDGGMTFRTLNPSPRSIIDAAISPDGQTLFVLGEDNMDIAVYVYELPSGELSNHVQHKPSRYMGASWSIHPLSSDDVLISARFNKISTDHFRAVLRVSISNGTAVLTGPSLSEAATGAYFGIGEPGGPVFLKIAGSAMGRRLHHYRVSDDQWDEIGFLPTSGNLHILDQTGRHLLIDKYVRSLDGGLTWNGASDCSDYDLKLYAGILAGDRVCDTFSQECESWSYAFPSGVFNIQPPSFIWHRLEDACQYKVSVGNLPFVDSLPGHEQIFGPCQLAPLSILGLGSGRAVTFVGYREPPVF